MEWKATIAWQLADAEAACTIKHQTSHSSRLGSGDGARSPEQDMKADSHKCGRGWRDTVTAEGVLVAAKGKSKAHKGKVLAQAVTAPKVSYTHASSSVSDPLTLL